VPPEVRKFNFVRIAARDTERTALGMINARLTYWRKQFQSYIISLACSLPLCNMAGPV